MPMSAGGRLSIYASRITNAGTLRAPFGSITLGWDGLDLKPATEAIDSPGNLVVGSDNFPVTQEVILRADSVTSVSGIDPRTGQGIVIPFGLSPDGNSWIDPRGVNVTTAGMPEKMINLAANSIKQEANSIIDLRGEATCWPSAGFQAQVEARIFWELQRPSTHQLPTRRQALFPIMAKPTRPE